MGKPSDLLLGRIVVQNRLVPEHAVTACLHELDRRPQETTLAALLVERGLLSAEEAEKADHAARLLQAHRYLKIATDLGHLDREEGLQALAAYRDGGYRGSFGRFLVQWGLLEPAHHRRVVACDPLTLEDDLPPVAPEEEPAPPSPRPVPVTAPAAALPPAPSGTGSDLPAPPSAPPAAPAPAGLVHLHQLDAEVHAVAALALRDRLLRPEQLEHALAQAPPEARREPRALLQTLVSARLLAHAHAEQILAYATLEREQPRLQVEGYYLRAPLGFRPTGPVLHAVRTGPDGAPQVVALEVLTAALAADPRRFEAFRARTAALSLPEAPTLAPVVDCGRAGEAYYLARRAWPEHTLAQLLARGRRLDERQAVRLARDVALALRELHDAGLVHGAVRPENIAFDAEGRAVLQDLGMTPLPAALDPEAPPPCADLPVYLAPEQLVGDRLDARTDLYGLGCTLFAALTGRPPYEGDSSAEVIAAVLGGQLPDLAASGLRLSPRLSGMIKVLLAAPAGERYRSADELLSELEAMGAGEDDRTVLYDEAGGPPPEDRTLLAPPEPAEIDELRQGAAGAPPVGLEQLPPPAPGAGTDPLAGTVLSGRYRLLERVGEGGMGVVYKAEHLLLRKLVAVKILHPRLLANRESLSRFDREVRAASRLAHPNVVQIYDAGEHQGPAQPLHYMVMEYVEGTDLETIIQREGELAVPRALHIARQVLMALEQAHEQGIVHRDMKSDNIMICRSPDGEEIAKVMDFGIAKLSALEPTTGPRRQQSFRTKKGIITGTPQYMSPEQAAGDPDIDARSDLYSFGVILYEMLLGTLPFHSNTAMGYLGKHIVEPPTPFRVARPDLALPPELERIVMKALEKRREDRYQSARAMREQIERCFALGGDSTAAVHTRELRRGRRTLRLVLAVVLLAALAAAAWGAWRAWPQLSRLFTAWQSSPADSGRQQILAAARTALAKGELETAERALAALEQAGGEPELQALRAALARARAEPPAPARERARLLERARELLRFDLFEEAERALAEAAALGSDAELQALQAQLRQRRAESQARSLESRAFGLERVGQYAEAVQLYAQAQRLAPSDSRAASAAYVQALASAQRHLEAGELEQARQAARQALAAARASGHVSGLRESRVQQLLAQVEQRTRASEEGP